METKDSKASFKPNHHKDEQIVPLFTNFNKNVNYIFEGLHQSDDLKMKDFTYRNKKGKILYLETMIDNKKVEDSFLKSLQYSNKVRTFKDLIVNLDIDITGDLNQALAGILEAKCLLILEDEENLYLFKAPLENDRDPEEPENEKVIRGSHVGFVESIDKNLNLIRKRITNKHLIVKYLHKGTESKSKIALIYLNNLASERLVDDIVKRIQAISMDMIFAPGYLEENLEEHAFSIFPQNLYTERPDRLKAHLMEGRVALLAEGSSDVIIMPVTFFSFFQSPDDYNNRFFLGSLFRLIRLLSFWGAIILPSLYIAVISFHFEIIPFELLRLVKSSIETVPFPPFFEALLMLITIELIREAGLRLPKPIGETIGIVGGLIIGDAVVNAGLVSNVMVIIIALTAIMSFTIPSYEMSNAVRILSVPMMIGAATLGFVGIITTLTVIIIHMCKLRTFNTPYFMSIRTFQLDHIKDTILRFPIWTMNKRPKSIHVKKPIRQGRSREWKQHEKF